MEITENNLVKLLREEIGNAGKENGLKTMDVRKVSGKIFRTLSSKEIGTVLYYCEILLEEKTGS